MKLKTYKLLLIVVASTLLGLQVIRASSGGVAATEPPPVISAMAPIYPPIARAARIGNEASVEVKINSSGEVISAKASGHPLLRAPAEYAARRWRFVPASGTSVEHTVKLTFVFTLMPRCAKPVELTPIFYPPYKVEVRGEDAPIICDDCSPAEQERLRCKNQ
jgi:TonB family protein